MADEKAGFGQRSQVGGLKGKMNDNKVVEIKNLVKSYGAKNFQTTVLKGIDLPFTRMISSRSWDLPVRGRRRS